MSKNYRAFYGLSSLLDSFLLQGGRRASPAPGAELHMHFVPAIQLCEDEGYIHFAALIPGASPENTLLELRDNCLVLRGEVPAVKGQYHRHERPTGIFQRVIPLPAPVTDEPVEAHMENGLLRVSLPKTPPCAIRTIQVTYSSNAGMETTEGKPPCYGDVNHER